MRTITCDGCGDVCVNAVYHPRGTVEHFTRNGEEVELEMPIAYDSQRRPDLCRGCAELLNRFTHDQFGFEIFDLTESFPGGIAQASSAHSVYIGPDAIEVRDVGNQTEA